jgi:predicted RNA-binding Zn ribbon-like protein
MELPPNQSSVILLVKMLDTSNPEPIETFELVGGRPCLDFANSVGDARNPVEKLRSYDDLLTFSRRVGLLDADAVQALAAEARRRPDDAERVLAEARVTRRAIFALFFPEPERTAEALGILDRAVARARSHQHLVATDDGHALVLERDDTALDRPLWGIALSAAELLISPDRTHVRACTNDVTCTWLFVDESKNHSRRWCSMRDCGNRVKAKRHYEKKRRG